MVCGGVHSIQTPCTLTARPRPCDRPSAEPPYPISKSSRSRTRTRTRTSTIPNGTKTHAVGLRGYACVTRTRSGVKEEVWGKRRSARRLSSQFQCRARKHQATNSHIPNFLQNIIFTTFRDRREDEEVYFLDSNFQLASCEFVDDLQMGTPADHGNR